MWAFCHGLIHLRVAINASWYCLFILFHVHFTFHSCVDMFSTEPIAVIGSACRFPGSSDTPSKLWQLLREPKDLLQKVSERRRWHPDTFYHSDPEHHGTSNVKSSYFLDEDPAEFDHSFFNIQPSECEAIDPQQRMLMEAVYDSLCSAGQTIEGLRGSRLQLLLALCVTIGAEYCTKTGRPFRSTVPLGWVAVSCLIACHTSSTGTVRR